MALLGWPLLIVLGGLAIVVPIVTIVVWPRVRGPRTVRGITRWAMLLAGQVAAIVLIAAVANDYGQFYTSWGDLFGVTGTPTITTYGGAPDAAARRGQAARGFAADAPATGRVRVLGTTSWSTPAQYATRGKVLSVSITGDRSHLSAPAFVYLPPQYLASHDRRRFPAVEVMTGYPGSALNLISRMAYLDSAVDLVRRHRAQPLVYVLLSSTVAPPRDTECTNIPAGPQAETFLGVELPSAIVHALRVRPDQWGVIGDSTGGYCAAKLAMLHPGTYAGGVSLSGYYHALNGGTAGDLFAGSTRVKNLNDLGWRLQHLPIPPASLFVTIGKDETIPGQGYDATMAFLKLVKPPMHVTALIEPHGGHNFATWNREIPRALTWLSQRITARAG